MQTSANPFTDKSGFLQVYFDGSNWIGIEPADLMSGPPLDAAISGAPAAVIANVLGSNVAIDAKAVGMCIGRDASLNPDGFTGAADQPTAFGTLRLHDCQTTWDLIETSQGVYDAAVVARLDAQIEAAHALGMDILYPVYLTPSWASGSTKYAPPSDPAYLTAFVNWLYARYGNKITHYEGWNEPNVSGSFSGALADLVTHQKTLYAAVKANDAALQVGTPGFGMRSGISTAALGFDNFMTAAYADSGSTGYYCDFISFHPYSETNNLRFDRGCIDALITARNTHGGASGIPIWMTEIGDSVPSIRAMKEQIAYSIGRGIKRVILYSWYNAGRGDMRLNAFGADVFDGIAALFQGKTMNVLNSYRSQNINSGGTPQVQGAMLGTKLDGVGVLLG